MSRSKLPQATRALHEAALAAGRPKALAVQTLPPLMAACANFRREVLATKLIRGSAGDGRCEVCHEPVESAATGRPRKYHDECYSLRRAQLA